MPEDQPENDQDPQEIITWFSILGHAKQEAKQMQELIIKAPPLALLKLSNEQVQGYTHVPETPPPRANARDRSLALTQKKVGNAMQLIIDAQEHSNLTAMGAALGFVRSAWEDLQQERRRLIAGGNSWRLQPTEDQSEARLLSEEEEKKIKEAQ